MDDTFAGRGRDVIKARKLSSAMSAAKAIGDHLRVWFFGTPEGEFTSMGVISDGSYGIDADLVYSMPVVVKVRSQHLCVAFEYRHMAFQASSSACIVVCMSCAVGFCVCPTWLFSASDACNRCTCRTVWRRPSKGLQLTIFREGKWNLRKKNW